MDKKVIVDTLRFTYSGVIRDSSGNKLRPIVTEIAEGSKTWENCMAFYAMSKSTGETIYKLMEAALTLYDSRWCKEKFGRPYLPFSVITGERVRNRLYQECVQENKCRPVSPNVEVDRIMFVLNTMHKDEAIALVKAGVMVGKDTPAQRMALERLRGGAKKNPGRLSVARKGEGLHTRTPGAQLPLPF